ncbi:nucleotidyltransferase family protein [Nostoc sp. TCL26-01]|uniref:nucleotidyltransferase domain-containing protein n=1 Tax=Nostoc sp. TCL26-01 TaxID=2576904 RepID=UPI0015B97BAC|nr:nucleotidyltransferase family protein [Nostoc sp. TCL26-01]QLE55803.1 nucleotidyltransferase family protein [Nostoc sp. TCL26-01]
MITLSPISTPTQLVYLDKEIELLLCCARNHLQPEKELRIKALLQQEINWVYVIKMATHHRIKPLLYNNLKNTCPEQVPPNVFTYLHGECQKLTLNNLFLAHKLINILKFLEANNIRAIPFKGPVLAIAAYGDIVLRKFGDLDILVKKSDIPKVIELLKSQQYQPEHYLTETRQELQQVFCEYSLISEDGRVAIDLHWELTPTYFPYKPDFDDLWERQQPVSFGGNAIPHFSLEDLVLYLCIHGCKDLWEKLSWICDIAELISVHPEIQWTQLWEQAQKHSCERMLLLGLCLAQNLQNINLPAEIQQKIRNHPMIEVLVAEVKQRLFSEIDQPVDVIERSFWSWRLAFHFRIMESLKHKILLCIFILQFAMTPKDKDYVVLPLPSWLSGLYYVIRPIRLIVKFGLTPLKRGFAWCVAILGEQK